MRLENPMDASGMRHSLSAHESPSLQTAEPPMSSSPLDFQLSSELEATEPPEARGLARDEVRLLVTRGGGPEITHTRFREIGAFLEEGDTLVINTSGTLNAALLAQAGDLTLLAHLSGRLADGRWLVELRALEGHSSVPYREGRIGMTLALQGNATLTLLAPQAPRS